VNDTRARKVVIAIAVVIGGLIVLNLLAQALDRAVGGSEPSGVTGSSYATSADGLAAYATLLHRFDHPVSIQRGAISDHPPDPASTVIALEPQSLTKDDSDALVEFVTNGGRLVVGGSLPYYLHNLRDQPPRWSSDGSTTWTNNDTALSSVQTISAAGVGAWTNPGSGRVLIGAPDHALVTTDTIGSGQIVFLADASPVENQYLAQSDNAAFGLALAGNRPVVFAEGIHGYGASRGISAIPSRWKAALLLLLLAALVFVWSRAKRFGPPDRVARELPPARAEYVRSLSLTLERTRDRAGAFGPAQQYTRDRVASKASLGTEPTADDIAHAARSLGCTAEETASLLTPATTDEQVLAFGRAAARVAGGDRRTS